MFDLSHSVGDQVLVYVAKRMRQSLRVEDTLARMGGDEFTVIVRETTDVGVIERLARTLLACVAEPLELDGAIMEVNASIGVAFFPHDGSDPDTLMKNADTAMYTAKAEGGGKVRFFEPAIDPEAAAVLAALTRDRVLAVVTKADLPPAEPDPEAELQARGLATVRVCAPAGQGLEALLDAMRQRILDEAGPPDRSAAGSPASSGTAPGASGRPVP